MRTIRRRAKNHLPTVLLTLCSIVQALALELLWAKIQDSGSLHVWSPGSLTGWLQVAATFTGIVLVWVLYANQLMRFRWVPSTLDSIVPFIIGLLQFMMVSWIGPTTVGKWLMAMGMIFAVMSTTMQRMMRQARLDTDNAAFFEGRVPATWRDFVGVMVAVTFLTASGAVIHLTGYRGWGVASDGDGVLVHGALAALQLASILAAEHQR